MVFKKIKEVYKKRQDRKEQEEKEKIETLSNKFIKVYFKINLSKDHPKKEVNKIAGELLLILINTQGIFSEKNEFIGAINPYLNQNAIFGYDLNKKQMTTRKLCRAFIPKVKKESNGDSTIFIIPMNEKGKEEMYSPLTFNYDFWILREINQYFLSFLGWEQGEDTFNPIFINGKPAIERKIGTIFRVEYKVEDRIKYVKDYSEFDKFLGADIEEFFNIVKNNKFRDSKIKLTKKERENIDLWIEKVKELLK